MAKLTEGACNGLKAGEEYPELVLSIHSIVRQQDAQGVIRFRMELRDSRVGDAFIMAVTHLGSGCEELVRTSGIRQGDTVRLTDYCLAQTMKGAPVLAVFAAEVVGAQERVVSPQKPLSSLPNSPQKNRLARSDTLRELTATHLEGTRKHVTNVSVTATVSSVSSFNMEAPATKKALLRLHLTDPSMPNHVVGLMFAGNALSANVQLGMTYDFEVEGLQKTKADFVAKDGPVQLIFKSAAPVVFKRT